MSSTLTPVRPHARAAKRARPPKELLVYCGGNLTVFDHVGFRAGRALYQCRVCAVVLDWLVW